MGGKEDGKLNGKVLLYEKDGERCDFAYRY